jgi:hypothetical protein
MNVYRHPVMFKSAPYGVSYADQGFIDNGRKIIPSGYLVVKKRSGRDSSGALLNNNVPVSIVDGDEEWTKEKLYLKNVGSQRATFTVIFLK